MPVHKERCRCSGAVAMQSTLLDVGQHQQGHRRSNIALLAGCVLISAMRAQVAELAMQLPSFSTELASPSVRGAESEALHQVQAAGRWQSRMAGIISSGCPVVPHTALQKHLPHHTPHELNSALHELVLQTPPHSPPIHPPGAIGPAEAIHHFVLATSAWDADLCTGRAVVAATSSTRRALVCTQLAVELGRQEHNLKARHKARTVAAAITAAAGGSHAPEPKAIRLSQRHYLLPFSTSTPAPS